MTKPKSFAEIVDGKLILSCPNAIKPIVWQMDLSTVKASALEIDEEKNGDNFALFLKSANGERTTIVTFANQKAALDTFMKTSKALRNAQGKIAAHQSKNYTVEKKNTVGRAFKFIGFLLLGLLATVAVLFFLSFMIPVNIQNTITAPTAGNPAINEAPENGVPLSADDFLRRR